MWWLVYDLACYTYYSARTPTLRARLGSESHGYQKNKSRRGINGLLGLASAEKKCKKTVDDDYTVGHTKHPGFAAGEG